jgi:hypothetical protein
MLHAQRRQEPGQRHHRVHAGGGGGVFGGDLGSGRRSREYSARRSLPPSPKPRAPNLPAARAAPGQEGGAQRRGAGRDARCARRPRPRALVPPAAPPAAAPPPRQTQEEATRYYGETFNSTFTARALWPAACLRARPQASAQGRTHGARVPPAARAPARLPARRPARRAAPGTLILSPSRRCAPPPQIRCGAAPPRCAWTSWWTRTCRRGAPAPTAPAPTAAHSPPRPPPHAAPSAAARARPSSPPAA